jgi:hypothetical protein
VIHETYVRRGQAIVKGSVDAENGGRPIAIPAWMFDRAFCATLRLSDRPLISLDALVELHTLVKRLSSTDDEDRVLAASLSSLSKGVPDANASSSSGSSTVASSTAKPIPTDMANAPPRGPTDHHRAARFSVAADSKRRQPKPRRSGENP